MAMSDDDRTGGGTGGPGKGGGRTGGKGRGPSTGGGAKTGAKAGARGGPRGDGPRGDKPRQGARPAAAGEGAKRSFADKPRKPFAGKPSGGKSYAGKRDDAGGDAARGGEGRPFRAPRGEGAKPFTPKSRGMFSHGGAKAEDGRPAKPRSYGSRSHDAASGGEAPGGEARGGERKPRPMTGERRDAADRRGGDGAKGGFRKERPARGDKPSGAARAERVDRRPREGGDAPASAGDVSNEAALTMRIARRLARAGVASRRDAEAMIAEGRVSVNGKVLETPALDVGPKDRITIDGDALPAIERTRLWLFHKPSGLVTTNKDPEGRPTVFEKLPAEMPRVLTIGRLDITTEGLLLLTNDGGLARVLELPATGWLRRYRVRAHGSINQAKLDELREGIAIDGVFYGAIEATLDREQGSNVWLTLGLREGKNREVKRVLGHLGLDVNRLIRLSYGPFQLADLKEGAVREIHGKTLRDQLGPRLIEEAGADFDAPIINEFSNKPVAPERAPRAKDGEARKSRAETAPNRKRQREDDREDALGRLDTRSDRPARGKPAERPARAAGAGRPDRADGGGRPARPARSEGPGGTGRPPRADHAGRSFDDKPQRARSSARDGEQRFGSGDRDEGRGPKRFSADRPARGGFGDRKFGEGKPGDRKSGDKKFGDKSFGDGKRGDAPADRPVRPPLGTRRLTNVWIAPGGRPMGPKKAASQEAMAERVDKPRAVDPTQRMGKKRAGAKPAGGASGPRPTRGAGGPRPSSGAGGAGGPRRPKKG
ncbi:pseudouridine synthase family protein [Aurantimonas sp. 22II-16-19i]|nr:pseudouridine synthase family protein [Aurantimonas sp. 22II-16-19i]